MLSHKSLQAAFVLALLLCSEHAAAVDLMGVPRGPLPDWIRPTAYELDLTVDPAKGEFAGRAKIQAVLTASTRFIYLHGRDLRVKSAWVSAPGALLPARYEQVDDSGVVRLDFPRELPPGNVLLTFDYKADFRAAPEGLFHAKVGEDWYAWTQMEAIDARRVFPGFDEPRFKTPFTLSVTVPAGAKVFANAPEVAETASPAGRVHRFAPTKPLPTYLVAIAVGPFDVLETTVPPNAVRDKPLPLRVIATRGQKPRMELAATEGPKLLGLLEDYMGMPYPYEKLDLAASPLQAGAMENAGLILFEDEYLLLDREPRLSELRTFATVTAHEMSHQWFGDLVTPTWWTDIWLNESFAEWMGNKVASQWRGDLGITAGELADAFAAMSIDALGRGRPVHQPIMDNSHIASAFDAITYLKGAQVLSMFESFVGPEKLREGIRQHLRSHAYGSATADDFFRSLATAAGDPKIITSMRTFIDQTGVPVIGLHEASSVLALTQERYHPLGVSAGTPQQWSIPLCLSRSRKLSCTLFETASAVLQAVPGEGPLVPNGNGAGYYRFRLDAGPWTRLIAEAGRLPPREAMVVGDSLWADFAAGTGSFARVVAGARALSEQGQAQAATALAAPLESLARSVLTEDELPGYRRVMGSIYTLRLAGLGLDPRRGVYAAEPAPQQLLRQALVPVAALEARDGPVRLKLANAAQSALDGEPQALDDAFRRAALSVAVQDFGVPFMTQLKEAMVKSDDPQLRADALAAIGSADTPALAIAALKLAYSPGLQPIETLRVVRSLARQAGARETVVNFVNDNFDRVLKLVPSFQRPQLIPLLFDSDCASGDTAKVDAWARTRLKALGGGELELAQVKEHIGMCVALREAKGAEIAAALGVPAAAAGR
jgi:aminopeptidase N